MTPMPHLPALTWDEDDRLRSTTRQVVRPRHAADHLLRLRRARPAGPQGTDWQAPAGQPPTRKAERIYLGGVEIYREYAADGTTVTLERETLHAGRRRRSRRAGRDPHRRAPTRHRRSWCATSTATTWARRCSNSTTRRSIISYEEYFPYGSTSYQAVARQTDLPKRYRYTGKERDEENDLYYHGARYYAPWLGRWTSCDPVGIGGRPNLYVYAATTRCVWVDHDGRSPRKKTASPGQTGESAQRTGRPDALRQPGRPGRQGQSQRPRRRPNRDVAIGRYSEQYPFAWGCPGRAEGCRQLTRRQTGRARTSRHDLKEGTSSTAHLTEDDAVLPGREG